MKALILAAGNGSRLQGADQGRPKGLLEVGGKALLDRQLEILAGLGIDRICLVTGHGFDALERRYAGRVEFRHNPFYRCSNNLVSVMFARDWVDDDLIILYADLLYEPAVLAAAVGSGADVGLVVDRYTVEQGHALVAVEDGLITEIDTQLPLARAYARHMGIGRFSRRGLATLIAEMECAAKAGQVDQSYLFAVRALLARGAPVVPIDISGRRWMEIDFPADLERARREWG